MSARREAVLHARKARTFLTAAERCLDAGYWDPAASDAVTAGINAKDAFCLAITGASQSSQDHAAAVRELAGSGPAGKSLAPVLKRLLAQKSKAQYGMNEVSAATAAKTVEWARRLVEAGEAASAGG